MQNLVHRLKRNGALTNPVVERVMLHLDRADFVPKYQEDVAYDDCPVALGDNATISAPHMHARVLTLAHEALPDTQARILDVGRGRGYLCAALGVLTYPDGIVVGLDHAPNLVKAAHVSLQRAAERELPTHRLSDMIKNGRVKMLVQDARQGYVGANVSAGGRTAPPFDLIIIGAAVEDQVRSWEEDPG